MVRTIGLYYTQLNGRYVGVVPMEGSTTQSKAPDQYFKLLLNMMGFLAPQQYLCYLPGRSSCEAEHVDFDGDYQYYYGSELNNKNRFIVDFREASIIRGGSVFYNATIMIEKLRCMFLLQPTIRNVIDGCNCSGKVAYDELWFCSDWKG